MAVLSVACCFLLSFVYGLLRVLWCCVLFVFCWPLDVVGCRCLLSDACCLSSIVDVCWLLLFVVVCYLTSVILLVVRCLCSVVVWPSVVCCVLYVG